MKGVLLDIDGVLHVDRGPIAGAGETVQWLRDEGIPHRFLTNTTSRPRSTIVEELVACGIVADVDTVWSPPAALAAWLADRTGAVALFAPEIVEVDLRGVDLLPNGVESGAGTVVIGDLGRDWTFDVLNRAFRLLMANPDADLVALGMTRYWRAEDGLRLDVGPFVAALREATGREPVVLGKPAAAFFDSAASALGLTLGDLLMVGDDIVSDVGGAQDAGITAALVKTGKFQPADLEVGVEPDVILDSIADLRSWWGENA